MKHVYSICPPSPVTLGCHAVSLLHIKTVSTQGPDSLQFSCVCEVRDPPQGGVQLLSLPGTAPGGTACMAA